MRRRDFLVTAAVAACQPLVSRSLLAAPTCVEGTDIRRNSTCPIPYENNIRDRMWMWGHDSGSLGSYISAEESGGKMHPAAAVKSIEFPTSCMVPFTHAPPARIRPVRQAVRRSGDQAVHVELHSRFGAHSQAIKAAALRQAAKNTRTSSGWTWTTSSAHAVPSPNGESAPIAPAALTPEQVIDVQKELNTTAPKCRGTKLDLSIVWYTHQINPSIKRHIDQVDVVYFWTWNANHLVDLEKNFKAFRDICPDVRVRLGVYMWNFNDKAVVDGIDEAPA